MKRLFPVFLTLLLLLGCEDEVDPTTVVSGQVVERGSNEPIDSALVHFVITEDFTYNVQQYPLDSTRSSKNGKFYFKEEVRELQAGERLLVYANAERYFEADWKHLSSNVSRGKTQSPKVAIIPYAWVRIHCLNTEGNDRLFINPPVGSGSVTGFTAYGDTTFKSRVHGNQQVELPSFFYKNEDRSGNKVVTVNSIAHDTVDVTINF